MKIFVINGPNINFLGIRKPEIYGKTDYNTLLKLIDGWANELGVSVECYQSNGEGELVTLIQSAYKNADGIVLNAAAYTHTSIAIRDAVEAVGVPTVSVHISDITKREPFRKTDYISPVCERSFIGKGIDGYRLALEYFAKNRG